MAWSRDWTCGMGFVGVGVQCFSTVAQSVLFALCPRCVLFPLSVTGVDPITIRQSLSTELVMAAL